MNPERFRQIGGEGPSWKIPQGCIGVEYLKSDPILFVHDTEQSAGVKRYDLIIW